MRGELARSGVAYREALSLARAGHDHMSLGRGVCGAAGIASASGDPARAARLFAAAQWDDEQIPLKPTIRAEHDRLVARVRKSLGEAAFAAAWAAGGAVPLEDTVGEAQAVVEAACLVEYAGTPSALSPPMTARLTKRKVEVLRLVAAGWADKEIAATLIISRHPASKHVVALRAKLGAPSRKGAVTAARKASLI